MESDNRVEKAQEAFAKSSQELERLKKEIERQNAEFSAIKKELVHLGINPDAIDLIPSSILSLPFPKELSGVANSFMQIMNELENLRATETISNKGKKVANPMNKLKML